MELSTQDWIKQYESQLAFQARELALFHFRALRQHRTTLRHEPMNLRARRPPGMLLPDIPEAVAVKFHPIRWRPRRAGPAPGRYRGRSPAPATRARCAAEANWSESIGK